MNIHKLIKDLCQTLAADSVDASEYLENLSVAQNLISQEVLTRQTEARADAKDLELKARALKKGLTEAAFRDQAAQDIGISSAEAATMPAVELLEALAKSKGQAKKANPRNPAP